MCNLYTVRVTAEEVARHFGVANPVKSNAGPESYPGTPGMVVREQDGVRIMQSMTWGFPMVLSFMKPGSKPKPVNNCADIRKPVWKGVAAKPQWRCLIPFTGFAEAEGPDKGKTRTWLGIKGQPIAAWAGLWRMSDEWGAVYTGVMRDANEAIQPIHNRMPVILNPEDYETWLHGSFDDAFALQERVYPSDAMTIDRTSEPWTKRKPKTEEQVATLI